jgi:thymidine kinase
MAQLYFYFSAMNAGKSTALLQSDYNYHERGMSTRLLTAQLDNRFGEGRIASRIGLEKPADMFTQETDLIAWHLEKPDVDCILIDEAQFLTREQVDQLAIIVDKHHVPVLCYGIRTDFQGELFSGSERLLAISDKLTELKTICHCGRKAIMVVRMDEHGNALAEGAQVQIGGNERYVSMCRKHYYDALAGQKSNGR